MQDRYAGDLGDYLKYGLLRWLCAAGASHPALRLGVIWYLVPDEDHNDDGKHVRYLEPGNRDGERLRTLDPDLYDRLARMVQSGRRSVKAIEDAGVLPPDTRTFSCPLDFRDLPSRAGSERVARRKEWLDGAMAATVGCDLIFADPDNGFRPAAHRIPRSRTKAVKYAYLGELAQFVTRGQSLVIYHHAGRAGRTEEQGKRRLEELEELARQVPGCTALGCVIARRGSVRLFLVAAAELHRAFLSEKLRGLGASVWGKELRVLP